MDIKSRLQNALESQYKRETLNLDGMTVMVQEMTAGAAQEYENSLYKMENGKIKYTAENAKTDLVMLTLCDEQGNRIYENKDKEQLKLLPASFVNKVFDIASKLNGLEVDPKN